MTEVLTCEQAEPAYAGLLLRLGESDWRALGESLQRVDSAQTFGSWTESVRRRDGSWTMPYANLSAECAELLKTLARIGLNLPFEWTSWDHGRQLAKSPQRLDMATPAQAAMLILATWRSDRFTEGALLAAFESGLIQRATRRVLSAQPVA